MTMDNRNLPLDELVDQLRRAAGTWFKNSDLLLLEELIRRTCILQRTVQKEEEKADG